MPGSKTRIPSRAFDSLISDRQPGRELDNARELPIDLVRENPQQARQHFDEAALDELAESIRQHGILQPLVVRPDGDGYVIVAGERRWRAAHRAGRTTVPALIREDLSSEADAAVVTALENLQREDLSTGDEARQYERLLAALGISQHELARQLGIDHNRIARLVKVLREAPEKLDEIDAGRQTLTGALAILAARTATVNETPILSHGETKSQASSSIAEERAPESAPDPSWARTPRVELDPVRSDQIIREIKPVTRFTQWAYHYQPGALEPDDEDALRKHLAEARTAIDLLFRLLDGKDAN